MHALSEQLKAYTHDLHMAAERHPVHADLFRGRRPLADFACLHGQTALIQRALEAALDASPTLATMIQTHHRRAAGMLDDARRMGATATEGEACRAAIDLITRADDGSLLGMWYVLEGATNGGPYILAALRRAHGPIECPSLDPHGEAQRERWGAFRVMIDGMPLPGGEVTRVIEGAASMFRGVIGLLDDVAAARV